MVLPVPGGPVNRTDDRAPRRQERVVAPLAQPRAQARLRREQLLELGAHVVGQDDAVERRRRASISRAKVDAPPVGSAPSTTRATRGGSLISQALHVVLGLGSRAIERDQPMAQQRRLRLEARPRAQPLGHAVVLHLHRQPDVEPGMERRARQLGVQLGRATDRAAPPPRA